MTEDRLDSLATISFELDIAKSLDFDEAIVWKPKSSKSSFFVIYVIKQIKFNGEIQKIRHYRYNTFFKEFFFLGGGEGGRQNFGLAQARRRSRAGPARNTCRLLHQQTVPILK